MKIKTSELTGATLDWAVLKSLGHGFEDFDLRYMDAYPYSTDWSQGGHIIEREKIWLRGPHDAEKPDGTAVMHIQTWYAHINHKYVQNAETPLIAAMRCYVANKLGDVVEIPDSLATGA